MAANPLAPMSPAAIAARIAGYTKMLPAPLSDRQVQARAQGTIDPLIAALTSRAESQQKAATGAIGGYANSAADKLGSYADSAQHIYGGAEQAQAGADAALSQALKGGGNDLAASLSSKLAALDAPGAQSTVANGVAQTGAGAGNALLAGGSSMLGNLISQGATAQDYAAKQPGLTRAAGLADIRDATLAGNKNLADNVSTVTQQLPSIVNSLRSDNETRATNRANASETARQYYEGRNDSINKFNKAEADAGLNATTKANAAVTTAKIKAQSTAEAAQAKAREKAINAQLSQVNKDRSWALQYARVYGSDPKTGQPTLAAVKAAAAAEKKAATKRSGLTAGEYANLKKEAAAQADTLYYGVQPVTRADGSVSRPGVPGVDYSTAVKLLANKYSLSVKDATTLANEYYKPGEDGRPKPVPKPSPDRGFRDAKLK